MVAIRTADDTVRPRPGVRKACLHGRMYCEPAHSDTSVLQSPKISSHVEPRKISLRPDRSGIHTHHSERSLFGLIVNVARSLAAPLVFFLLFAPLLPIYS